MRVPLPQFVGVLALVFSVLNQNGANATCPASLKQAVFIGNSYTGGRNIGKVCDIEGQIRPECQKKAIPGNVRAFFQDPTESYPGTYDVAPPNVDNLFDPNQPYHPLNNPHLGDVPSKIKLLADYICGDNAFEYTQNTQSAFTTRTHANQASSNPQNGTIKLLEGDIGVPLYNVVVIQPQSTEYLNGATDTRVSALEELMKLRSAAPTSRKILQQTWPRRDATTYNQICSTKGKNKQTGMLQEIDDTIAALSQDVVPSFQVAPTGSAFVQFALLACGPSILPAGDCAFDTNVYCPIWFGDENGKASLYDEAVGEEGSHQSDSLGAWLSAAALYGSVQSETPCCVSEAHLAAVMSVVSNDDVADIPSGMSITHLISEAAKLALEERYGPLLECTNGSNVITPAPSMSSMPSTNPSSSPSFTPTDSNMPTSQPSLAPTSSNNNPDPTASATCGLRGLVCCSVGTACTDGSTCKKNGICRGG